MDHWIKPGSDRETEGYEGERYRCHRFLGERYGWEKHLRGSFTIEAALLVPLILGILFLLLQTVVSLHDMVCEEAHKYEESCCNEEQGSWRFVQIAGAVLEEWEEWKS